MVEDGKNGIPPSRPSSTSDSPEYDVVPVLDRIVRAGAELDGAWYAWWSPEDQDDDGGDADDPDALIVRAAGELYAFWHGWRSDGPALCGARRGEPGWPWTTEGDLIAGIIAQPTAVVPCRARLRPGLSDGDHVVEALRADADEVVLAIGWEWYSYSYLPVLDVPLLDAVSGRVVHPGEEVELTTPTADGEYVATRITLMQSRASAESVSAPRDWEIVDVRVGGRTQLSAPGPIPAAVFSPASVDAVMKLDLVTPDRALSIVARYTGSDPAGSRLLAQVRLTSTTEVSRRSRRLLLRAHAPLLRETP